MVYECLYQVCVVLCAPLEQANMKLSSCVSRQEIVWLLLLLLSRCTGGQRDVAESGLDLAIGHGRLGVVDSFCGLADLSSLSLNPLPDEWVPIHLHLFGIHPPFS